MCAQPLVTPLANFLFFVLALFLTPAIFFAYYNLIFITGDGAKENIYGLFNMLSTKPYLFGRIKSIIRIGNRRWNFELDNGIIIKMPENDIIEAWEKLDKIISIKGSEINIKSIDLRNKDKILLEEDKATD